MQRVSRFRQSPAALAKLVKKKSGLRLINSSSVPPISKAARFFCQPRRCVSHSARSLFVCSLLSLRPFFVLLALTRTSKRAPAPEHEHTGAKKGCLWVRVILRTLNERKMFNLCGCTVEGLARHPRHRGSGPIAQLLLSVTMRFDFLTDSTIRLISGPASQLSSAAPARPLCPEPDKPMAEGRVSLQH